MFANPEVLKLLRNVWQDPIARLKYTSPKKSQAPNTFPLLIHKTACSLWWSVTSDVLLDMMEWRVSPKLYIGLGGASRTKRRKQHEPYGFLHSYAPILISG